jgi:putative ABC transport system permease protein
MHSIAMQVWILLRISAFSLARRGWITASMVISIALTSMLLLGFLSMVTGFRTAYLAAGSADVAIALSVGSTSEAGSRLSIAQLHALEAAPGIARNQDGEAMTSAELQVAVDAVPRASELPTSVSLRGIGANGFALRPGFQLTEGRLFLPGQAELVVGRRIAATYPGFQIGSQITFGSSKWTVAGIFEAEGSVFESEIFADLAVVQTLFNRQGVVQSLRLRLSSPLAIATLQAYVDSDRNAGVSVRTESDFYADQTSRTSALILWFGVPLALAISIGAIAGTVNTMAASVSDRAAEIATVRALGFSPTATFLATALESCCLAVIGGVLGIVCVMTTLDGWSMSTLGSNGTQVGFALTVSLDGALDAFALALAIGMIGGGVPALAAARTPIRDALRLRI